MAIKQIQLRGISRTPSDRMTRDGGLAESLNVQLEGEELAPMRVPSDVTESLLGAGATVFGKIVYVHKGNSFENYIELVGAQLYSWVNHVRSELPIGTLDEPLQDINANGMVLITITATKAHYFILKDGAYLDLGTEAPDPGLEFKVVPAYEGEGLGRITLSTMYDTAIRTFNTLVWNKVISQPEANLTAEEKAQRADAFAVMQDAWDKVSLMVDNNRQRKIFSMPVLARYGVKLFDGTYVNVSQPVYLGGGVEEWVWMDGGSQTSELDVHLVNLFRAFVKADSEFGGFGNWKDLVQSVDVFLSDFVPFPAFDAKIRKVEAGSGSSYLLYLEGTETDSHYKNSENAVLAATNFYNVASFSADEIEQLTEVDLLDDPQMGSQSYRETQTRLREDTLYGIVPDGVMAYNGRAVAKGASYRIPGGYKWIFAPGGNAEATISPQMEVSTLNIRYYLRDGGGVFSSQTVVLTHHSTFAGFGVLFFPDARCFGAWIEDSERATFYWVEMKEHPGLNCSYGFFGTSRLITQEHQSYAEDEPASEGNLIPMHNKMLLTQTDNFIVYGLGNTLTFDDAVVDVAIAVRALTTQPFGPFPLYVFTEGGVYEVALMADGSFGNTNPRSRDVALRGTVSPIDRGVVFTTEKGVMLLQGDQIQDISQVMLGKHHVLDAGVASLLEGDEDFAALLPSVADPTPFMAFMRSARAMYDYKGGRLIFFNDTKPYQYVLSLSTLTWHKTAGGWEGPYQILNAYPDGLVGATEPVRTVQLEIASCLQADYTVIGQIIEENSPNTGGYTAQEVEDTLRHGLPAIFDMSAYGAEQIDHIDHEMNTLATVDFEFLEGSDLAPRLLDFSTVLSDEDYLSDETNVSHGIIVTRPLSFDSPDIRKAVKDLVVRGGFNRPDVKWRLLGSLDGHSWKVLSSLRGGSYKWFRLVLLTALSPLERISWVDVDVEDRYTGRLR